MENTQSIAKLVKDVENKYAVLPEFQRDFVWEKGKTLDLFDSIVKDIFIGAIIYGIPSFDITIREVDSRPRKQKGSKRASLKTQQITKEEIQKKQQINKDEFRLILDGQQRLTSLYRALKGFDEIWFIMKRESELSHEVAEKEMKDRNLEEFLYSFDTEQDDNRLSICLSDAWEIMNTDYFDEEINDKYFKKTSFYNTHKDNDDFNERNVYRKYRALQKKIADLFKAEKLLSYYLLDMSMDKFVLFFERSNSRGVQLNFIDILTAKLYTGFNLKQHIKEFEKKNTQYKLQPEIIVRALAFIIGKEKAVEKGKGIEIHRTFILSELDATHFNTYWNKLTSWYKNAFDYLYVNNFIISQDWIPYLNMVIPLMIFQKELEGGFDQMNEYQAKFLKYWYWASIFSQRYTGSSNEKIISDSNILTQIAKNEKIQNRTFFSKLNKFQIHKASDLFSYDKKRNAIYKGVLNLINYNSNGFLDWNNTSKISFNSPVDDHHIYPRDYIRKNFSQEDEAQDFIDCVVNRTLIPKITNIKIGNKPPSEYLSKLLEKNPKLSVSLASHVIPKELLNGDYDKEFTFFLELRADDIFKILSTKVFELQEEIIKEYYKELQIDTTQSIKVFAKYYKNIIEAQFNPTTQKVSYKGQLYDSPSAAAIQAKIDVGAHEQSTANGWKFWKFVNPNNGEEDFIHLLREK